MSKSRIKETDGLCSKAELTKVKEDKSELRGEKLKGYGKLLAGQPGASSCNMLDMVLVKLLTINQNVAICCPFQGGFASQLVSSCDRKMPTLLSTIHVVVPPFTVAF